MKIETMEPEADTSEMNPKVVSEAEWLVARKDLLTREKELTRLRDEVSRHRRELPWVKVDKGYIFDGPDGRETLADLFDGRSQLIVYHFMFGPGWEEGCKSCSYLADHFDGANWHLPHRDVTFVVISRAPLSELEPYKKRMGWRFKWLSSHGNDFNFDYHVSATEQAKAKGKMFYNYRTDELMSDEMPGLSAFYRDENGDVFHTIPHTHADSTSWSGRTICSTSFRRVATRTTSTLRWIGCGGAMIIEGRTKEGARDESRHSF